MRIERLSSGYYLTELYVEAGGEAPQINDYNYRDLQFEVHHAGDADREIVFQVDGTFIPVEPSENVPIDVVELPKVALEKLQVKNPPARREIMIPEGWMLQFLRGPFAG